MKERAVLDTSFLVNLRRLEVLKYLCDVFNEILISPEVWKESFQFHQDLEKLNCITKEELTTAERERVNELHEEFSSHYAGKHVGEIETLVLSQSRGYFLVISDNFAPWYIRKHHEEYSEVKIFRGTYFFTRLFELGKIKIDFFDKLIGTYSTKDIFRIKQRYGNHE